MGEINIYRGNIVFSKTEKELAEYRNGYIVVEGGKVEGIYERVPERFFGVPVRDFGSGVIIPAFSDLHTHAPQYPQRGLKTDALLKEWLEKYTFPLEGRFVDPEFAGAVYDAFVEDLIRHGTMHVVTFGTIHEQATGMLIEKLEKKGIDAYVGKVNMDENSPEYLCEKTEESLLSTERFLEKYCGNRRARPILTPRFTPTCSGKLLVGLGKLAKKYGVGMQTHLVESLWEKKEAVRLFPDCSCDTEAYEKAGLFGHGPLVGAHFIFPSEEDIRILKKYSGYAVQCPEATVNVIAGIMPTAQLLERGVKLGLGSDVAAGQSLAVFNQVAKSVQLSKIKSFYEPENEAVSFAQAFFMATKQGGSLFGKTGSLEKGYAFDALVIDGLSDDFTPLSPAETVERFCYAGGVDNIRARFFRGDEIG
ncbi:MAG: amidohydrolase family protein [Clostridia bacterium]|nr:amidohydrolase family protein [Clostridia bacterium]